MDDGAYPRGSFVLAALSIAVLIVVLGWKAGGLFHKTTPIALNDVPVAAPSPFIEETDSDKDGVPDWQESLLGTDPYNSEDFPKTATTTENTPYENETAADAVSDRLLAQYLTLKEANAYTAERGERLGESLADNLQVNTAFIPYTDDELTIQDDTSPDAVAQYRNRMQEALEPFLGLTTPEFELYARFIDSKDSTVLDALHERAAIYKKVAQDIVSVPVPKDATLQHREVANSLAFFGVVLENMVKYSSDPIASLALLRTYNEAEQYVGATFNALSVYYNGHIR